MRHGATASVTVTTEIEEATWQNRPGTKSAKSAL